MTVRSQMKHRETNSLSYFLAHYSNVTQSGSSKVSKHRFDSQEFQYWQQFEKENPRNEAFKLTFGDREYKNDETLECQRKSIVENQSKI